VSPISKEAEVQVQRVTEFFNGPTAREDYERLRHFAEIYTRRYERLCSYHSRTGEDFLHDAVTSCLTIKEDGTCLRNIPPAVPLVAAFTEIIKSKIGHAFTSLNSVTRGKIPDFDDDAVAGPKPSFEPQKPFWESENDRLSNEEREVAASRFESLIAFAKPDRLVHGMLVLIRDENLDKPASLIAERLGVTEPDIYVARKRLATLVERFSKNKRETK
jgi:hypothetical protein